MHDKNIIITFAVSFIIMNMNRNNKKEIDNFDVYLKMIILLDGKTERDLEYICSLKTKSSFDGNMYNIVRAGISEDITGGFMHFINSMFHWYDYIEYSEAYDYKEKNMHANDIFYTFIYDIRNGMESIAKNMLFSYLSMIPDNDFIWIQVLNPDSPRDGHRLDCSYIEDIVIYNSRGDASIQFFLYMDMEKLSVNNFRLYIDAIYNAFYSIEAYSKK